MELLLVLSQSWCLVLVRIHNLTYALLVNETAPVELKGPLGATFQVLVTVGIMVSFALALPIPSYPPSCRYDEVSCHNSPLYQDFTTTGYWRVLFALPIAFSII
jgi:hypothetical protein